MQNIQKYRDSYHYHNHAYAPNQIHLNGPTGYHNIYSSGGAAQSYANQSRPQVQLSPSLSVPASVSPVSGYFPSLTDLYYQNNLTLPVQYQMPVDTNSSNQQFQPHQGIQFNQHNFINIQTNYKVIIYFFY